jgi:hypothetical protein
MKNVSRVPDDKLEAVERSIIKRRDEEIERIKRETAAELKAISDRKKRKDRKERMERTRELQKMAFAIGSYLLRNGVDDATVKAIVGTDGFERFMQSPQFRGRRKLFGLSEMAPARETPKAPIKKQAAA